MAEPIDWKLYIVLAILGTIYYKLYVADYMLENTNVYKW